MSDLKQKLAEMQEGYEASRTQYDTMFGGVKIPASIYIAQLQHAEVQLSKSSSKAQIKREHIILEGDYKGSIIYDYINLETPMGFAFARKWVDQMGYESPQNASDLIDVVKAISDESVRVKIQVVHNGDFVNISVNELLDGDDNTSTEQNTGEPAVEEVADPVVTPEAEIDELTIQLRAFCQEQDIKFEEDDNAEHLAARIAEFGYPEEQLTSEQIDMFKAANIESAIVKTAKPTIKKAAKTEVKKEAPAAPKKTVKAEVKKENPSAIKKSFKKK